MTARHELTGIDKAVAEVLDEILVRGYGIRSGGRYEDWFIDWLHERGYVIVPVEEVTQ